MTRLLFVLLLLIPCALQALELPGCVPRTLWTPFGTGSDWVRGEAASSGVTVHWRAWWCPLPDGSWAGYVHGNVTSAGLSAAQIERELDTAARSADKLAALKSAVERHARPFSAAELPAYEAARAQARSALEVIRPKWHRVKPNPLSVTTPQTRPVRRLFNGVLGGEVSGARAVVGATCNTSRPTLASGADVWAEFGPAFKPGEVALCSK